MIVFSYFHGEVELIYQQVSVSEFFLYQVLYLLVVPIDIEILKQRVILQVAFSVYVFFELVIMIIDIVVSIVDICERADKFYAKSVVIL